MKNWSFKRNKEGKLRAARGFVCCQGQTNRNKGFGAPKPLQMNRVKRGSLWEPGGAHPRASTPASKARMGALTYQQRKPKFANQASPQVAPQLCLHC